MNMQQYTMNQNTYHMQAGMMRPEMNQRQHSMNQNTYHMQAGMTNPGMNQQLHPMAQNTNMQAGMTNPEMNQQQKNKQLHDFCTQHRHHLVNVETTDGQVYDGIIDAVQQDGVFMLIPMGEMERENNEELERQFGFGFFPRRFRFFRPFFFPFFFTRRFFFPFFF